MGEVEEWVVLVAQGPDVEEDVQGKWWVFTIFSLPKDADYHKSNGSEQVQSGHMHQGF